MVRRHTRDVQSAGGCSDRGAWRTDRSIGNSAVDMRHGGTTEWFKSGAVDLPPRLTISTEMLSSWHELDSLAGQLPSACAASIARWPPSEVQMTRPARSGAEKAASSASA